MARKKTPKAAMMPDPDAAMEASELVKPPARSPDGGRPPKGKAPRKGKKKG